MKHPEDLDRILSCLPDEIFSHLNDEPSIKDAEEVAKFNESEGYTEEDVKEYSKIILSSYNDTQRFAKKLHEYGKNREEIIFNLKKHIKDCGKCMKKYFNYIVDGAQAIQNSNKRADLPFEDINVKVKEFDKDLLKLL